MFGGGKELLGNGKHLAAKTMFNGPTLQPSAHDSVKGIREGYDHSRPASPKAGGR